MSKIRAALLLTSSFVLIGILALFAGRLLVVDRPEQSDFIVVLAGDIGDYRLQHALELLNQGYGRELLIDVAQQVKFGRPMYEYAEEYANNLPVSTRAQVHVCRFAEDSTQGELLEIAACIKAISPSARSGLVVTSNYHSRRALSVAKRLMPQYRWSVGAAPDPEFDVSWWKYRESAKICFTEWEKMAWWQLFDRWKNR